ncbi:MAG TPA: trehalose-6-phosphate synthase [Steroidobacteraceae bacterium]|nr:trehalose-6-phosphate synthase [Steroidobacteraceae bacterium]
MRSILIRFGIPTLVAVSLLAYFGVPYADRLLADWFRSDVNARAQLVANSMAPQLGTLLDTKSEADMRAYLGAITTDERLLSIMLCRVNHTLIYKTERTPDALTCERAAGIPDAGSELIQLKSGSIQVSSFPFSTSEGVPFKVLVIHDLSFIDRRQSTARNHVLALAGVLATLLALLVGTLFWFLVRRWVSVLVGDIRGLRFLDDARSGPASWPVLKQVHLALRDIESTQRLEIDFRENWTPQALQQVVREHLDSPEMFAVSNREPYIHNRGPDGPVVQVPASGMVTALEPIMRACAGTWVAHGSGSADRDVVDGNDRVRVPPEDPSYSLRRVWLSPEEEEGYYFGFSNEGIWPLCHLAYVRPAFRESDWEQYQRVNQKFADVVADESRSRNPVVLVQDFHFALLPRLLRRRKPNATIALFWHIPWPNAETFGVCPWKAEMLSHMLAADILGFHTRHHCQNFLASVDRFMECQIDHEHMTVTLRGHVCRVVPYPISIEWPPRWLAQLPDIETCARAVRARHGIAPEVTIGLGVERWDFTKGIVERFRALETLLDKNPALRGKISLLQVAAPTRSKLPAYLALQEQTLAEAARINSRFASDGWKPIVLIDHHQEPREVFEMFRAADFCVVNSLHDGMNLVAKEYVAARDDEDGVLILSTFAGASRELPEALLVNPFDVGETAAAMVTAMQMRRDERRVRMKAMRRTVKENNVYRWAGRMLMDAAQVRQRQSLQRRSSRAG